MRKILVLGGTRYFGKRFVQRRLDAGDDVTIATRGQTGDPFGNSIRRIQVDRDDATALMSACGTQTWDLVVDQIAYSPDNAKAACEAFSGRVGRYLLTSTQSVYENYGLQRESDFEPRALALKSGPRSAFSYAEGKRQAEATFFQTAPFPVVATRIPIVLGPDDYTGRLEFHIDRVRQGRPIVVPNLEAEMTFIHSQGVADFLSALMDTPHIEGPINACSHGRISMRALLGLIEQAVGRSAVVVSEGAEADHTPFTGPKSRLLDNSKATTLGFHFGNLTQWLPSLIRS